VRTAPSLPAALFLGPLGWTTPLRRALGVVGVVAATVLTQVLGLLLWPALGLANHRGSRPVATAVVASVAIVGLSQPLMALVAPLAGRVPLPCWSGGPLRPKSAVFCLAHRHYVVPELRRELEAIAARVGDAHPNTVVSFLDAGFPLGGPLLPHLSHHDGRKVDLALFGTGGSPVGYFGYAPGPAACPPRTLDLRWDLDALQPWIGLELDEARTATLLREAARAGAIGKLLIEPHLERRLGVRSNKLRFQGCRAARHDDHVHLQL